MGQREPSRPVTTDAPPWIANAVTGAVRLLRCCALPRPSPGQASPCPAPDGLAV